jgi:hypothetical protein
MPVHSDRLIYRELMITGVETQQQIHLGPIAYLRTYTLECLAVDARKICFSQRESPFSSSEGHVDPLGNNYALKRGKRDLTFDREEGRWRLIGTVTQAHDRWRAYWDFCICFCDTDGSFEHDWRSTTTSDRLCGTSWPHEPMRSCDNNVCISSLCLVEVVGFWDDEVCMHERA